MSDRMMQFTVLPSAMPAKSGPDVRRAHFGEIYDGYAPEAAAAQSSRCEQCGVPFCQVHCPLSNNIPDWLRLTAEGRYEEAYHLSAATNSMPEICGRICPQDRLCEGSCVIEQSGHGTVTIGAVEKFLTDKAFEEGWAEPPKPGRERPESVGIVGAGPAGLACAEQLRERGYKVVVYDRHDRPGGLLTYGIPGFKLEKSVVMRRIALLREAGIEFRQNADIGGAGPSFATLRARHDALFIGIGVYKPRALGAPGEALDGVVRALDYLVASNRKSFGDNVAAFEDGRLNAHGKNVVVIGGGDTAMDCVRTAVRQGARSVKCLYRRDRANMPGSAREVANAEEEGVEFVWLAAPEALIGDGKLAAVQANKMRLGLPDQTGRRRPEPVAGGAFVEQADLAIAALGFEPEDLGGLFGEPALELTPWGTILVDHRFETSLEGVYAGGDIVRGASLVVWAVKEGRDAAASIHAYLQEKTQPRAAS